MQKIGKKALPKIGLDDEPSPLVKNKVLGRINILYNNLEIPEWKKLLAKSLCTAEDIAKELKIPVKQLQKVCEKYPAMINPYYLSLIKKKNDPIYRQCIPQAVEMNDNFGLEDPLHEEPEHQNRKNVPSLLTHRYPDRVLFRISNQCAMYCRFCTRKRKVGDLNKQPTTIEYNKAIDYIKKHKEIRDVILSGGDPLMLEDRELEKIIKEVYLILRPRTNSIIRIGTRIPCVLPQRITENLCQMLKKYHPIFINTHFDHPDEITEQSKRACGLLADAGIPLGCQTVLLKGVNDNPKTMKLLLQKLISIRVKPYYIFQADLVKGTNHFRTRVEKGLEIIRGIRGFTSGLCIPHYVIDAPGGGGKIPLLPEYMLKMNGKKIILKNYENKRFEYPQIEET